MFEVSEKPKFIITDNLNDENLPSPAENQQQGKREVLYLSPNQRFPKTKLQFKRIPSDKSQWYDWFAPAPIEIWSQNEGDELTGLYRQKFSEYVHFETCFNYYQMFPVEIPFIDFTGKQHKYTPLALLTFSLDLMFCSMKPVLLDVRSRNNIKENWSWIYPAWHAANHYAKQNGWNFCLIRDEFFTTPLYQNAAFLLRYRSHPFNEEHFGRLLKKMRQVEKTTVQELLTSVSRYNKDYIKLLPQLWQMLDANYIFFDVKQSLTMNTMISI
jgi:hypothetical protein